MAPHSNAGEEITLAEATTMTTAFRDKFPDQIKAYYVSSDSVLHILQQPDCTGLRIYNAYDDTAGALTLVMVGVDANGVDLSAGLIVDRMRPCPDFCDTSSPLMNP